MRNAKPTPSIAGLLVAAAGLAGCVGAGADGATGTWIGRLQTVSGVCPDSQDSDLAVTARSVIFVPGDGVIALRGTRDRTDRARLHAQARGAAIDHKVYAMVFDGVFTPNGSDGSISGTYGTPECRATIRLHRPTHTALQRLLGD